MELRGKIVKQNEARPSFEGEEFCRNYFKTERITFGDTTAIVTWSCAPRP